MTVTICPNSTLPENTIWLGSGYESYPASLIFGELVKRSGPIKRYHGDLFHDALWLAENEPEEFYWTVSGCGTHICTPDGWPELHGAITITHAYRFQWTRDDRERDLLTINEVTSA